MRMGHIISYYGIRSMADAELAGLTGAMECCRWMMEGFGGRVQEIVLLRQKPGRLRSSGGTQGPGCCGRAPMSEAMVVPWDGKDTRIGATSGLPIVLSLLGRRPGLVKVVVKGGASVAALAEAVAMGYCQQVQELDVRHPGESSCSSVRRDLFCLLRVLKGGGCPLLQRLRFKIPGGPDQVMMALGETLRVRMEGKGGRCCGLKVLQLAYTTIMGDLGPVLSSGACENLEELRLGKGWMVPAHQDLPQAEWLRRTGAPHLRAFVGHVSREVAEALAGPGVAPLLQCLDLGTVGRSSLSHLTNAIERGAWPDLQEVRLEADRNTTDLMPRLMEAIRVGAPRVRMLGLNGNHVGREGGVAVAWWLHDGAAPCLEELSLWWTILGDSAVVELARALQGGAPCSTTLRRLNLQFGKIHSKGVMELARAWARGACPNLEEVNLGYNNLKVGLVCQGECLPSRI